MTGHLRVLSIYEGFFSGGARMLHSDVLSGLHGRRGQQHSVLSIHAEVRRESTFQRMHEDACYRRLVADGLEVHSLERAADDDSPFHAREIEAVARLAGQADLVLTLKEQPLRLVNRAVPDRPVITCLHRTDPEHQGPALEELLRAASSGQLAAAVCCAESTRDAYAAAGVPENLLHVIPNGVDLRRFKPNRRARTAVRAAAGIPAEAEVVVFAARYDEMKNVPLFLAAAQEFLARRPDGHVLMCGAGMSTGNPGLLRDLAAVGLGGADVADAALAASGRSGRRGLPPRPGTPRVHLLGVRPDPEAVFAAADVVALTSAFGEAAPLCLIEGMLCGAVPVATDVGDCAAIVAGHGLITPAEASAVVEGWVEALEAGPHFRQAVSRNRYRFGRARMIGAYGTLIRRTHRRSRIVLPSAELPRAFTAAAVTLTPALPAPAGVAVSVSAVP